MHGRGGNGKNVYLDAIAHVMSDYAIEAESDLLLAKQNESHPTGIADLDGARAVVCSEIDEGRAWNEALIKRITGNRRLKARHMREDFYHFDATHKLIIAANSKPKVRGTDYGIWRRMNLVPFGVTIPEAERDKTLIDRIIAEESSGVLARLVRGFAAWQLQGLGHCAAIDEATKRYREEQDVLGLWIAEECVVTPGALTSTTALHDAFTEWCERTRRPPWTRDAMRARLDAWPGVTERRTILRGATTALVWSVEAMIGGSHDAG
jgi:putative DNA primase/helicase